MRVVFFANPMLYFWHRLINEIQEFSCDEVMIGRKNFKTGQYISSLVEAAENCLHQKRSLASAAGLSFVTGQNLKRRITTMLSTKQKVHGRKTALVLTLLSLITMSAVAFASRDTFRPRNISPDQSKAYLAEISIIDPATNSKEVSDTLNAYLNDPLKRKFLRDSLGRLNQQRPELEAMAREYGVPSELLAIAIIESGYQNLPAIDNNINRSAGVWQFIAKTARKFGLTVTPEKDDRFDNTKSANAAFRYLAFNQARFDSWDLSVLSYNAGEKAVEAAMEKAGSKNPWLVKKHLPGETQRYYSKWLAAMIVMNNPEIVAD